MDCSITYRRGREGGREGGRGGERGRGGEGGREGGGGGRERERENNALLHHIYSCSTQIKNITLADN